MFQTVILQFFNNTHTLQGAEKNLRYVGILRWLYGIFKKGRSLFNADSSLIKPYALTFLSEALSFRARVIVCIPGCAEAGNCPRLAFTIRIRPVIIRQYRTTPPQPLIYHPITSNHIRITIDD